MWRSGLPEAAAPRRCPAARPAARALGPHRSAEAIVVTLRSVAIPSAVTRQPGAVWAKAESPMAAWIVRRHPTARTSSPRPAMSRRGRA